MKSKVEIILLLRKEEMSKDSLSVWERDNKKDDFSGTLNEYVEMGTNKEIPCNFLFSDSIRLHHSLCCHLSSCSYPSCNQ